MKRKLFLLFLLLPLLGFAQFNQGFEGSTALPLGWTVINGGDTNTWQVIDFTGGAVTAHAGTNAVGIGYSSTAHADYLVTPAITVAAASTDLISFWGRSRDPLYQETVAVKLSTTGNAAADFTVTLAAAVSPPGGAAFQKYSYDLTAYVGQTVYVAFYITTTDQFYFDIDDVVSGPKPTCMEPASFAASGITTVAANLGWTSTATSFEVEYGITGFTQGTGTMVNVTTGTTTPLSSLTPDTNYTAYIRANCGSGDFSPWTSTAFKTLAVPAVNDNCGTATALTVGTTFVASAVTSTSVNASTGTVVPSCSSSAANDVWFSVVVPADGKLTLETGQDGTSGNDDTIMAAFTGTCGALVPIASGCNDDNPDDDTSFFSKLSLTGLTPGQTIYVGVWQYEGIFGPATPGTFKIAAYNATLGTETFDASKFAYYPNPVKDVLNLSYAENISSVSVYNLLGQEVMTRTINANQAQLDMSALVKGVYLVNVNSENLTKTVKVVKQ
ncbi:T9SS-dependent choice-of-anchor J family protein [Flavobacterium sp. '19STA2R22 D10 B1']|uniref:T9SS-dependent choice-of-anchor J family protein n=1 Tax=Flavobacterium aerium TaxID=3037261 RepID=UPI00278BE003|nr:choice-of-anchor J domain-containing protein [Flavobacterium sp. '19STA2R22 D10 B1']